MNGAILSDVATIERIAIDRGRARSCAPTPTAAPASRLPSENRQIGRIIEFAGVAFSVSDGAILGPTGPSAWCRARFAIAWVAREAFGFSSAGDRPGARRSRPFDVLTAQRRAEELRAEDEDYREITDRLLALVTPKKSQEEEAENAPSSH
jgi:hypothetical protein